MPDRGGSFLHAKNADRPGAIELLKPLDLPERLPTIGVKENYLLAEGLYVCLGKGYLNLCCVSPN